jgi:hypothetical protein
MFSFGGKMASMLPARWIEVEKGWSCFFRESREEGK